MLESHLDVGSVPLSGTFKRQVGQGRLLTSSNVHLEHISGLERYDADDGLSFGRNILRTETQQFKMSFQLLTRK